MMLEETIRILSMQEEILQFPHFTNKDAWELGSYMVSEAAHNGLPVVISIRLNNGYTLFQYGFKGTNLDEEKTQYCPDHGDEQPSSVYGFEDESGRAEGPRIE